MDEVPWGAEEHAPGARTTEFPELRVVADDERPAELPDPTVYGSLALRPVKRPPLPDGTPAPQKLVPKNTQLNVFNILRSDPRWAGNIRFNSFDFRLYVQLPDADKPSEVSDVTATMAVLWIEQVYELATEETKVAKAMAAIGDEFSWHPVRDYLRDLRWDGVERLPRLVSHYLNGVDTEINAAYGRCWLVSAVARVMDPGCKVDTTPVLVGKQGDRKSTAIKMLSPKVEWWSETGLELRSKDLYDQIAGVWVYEIQEIDHFGHHDWSKVKTIMSSTIDRWRKPFERYTASRPRQVVFFGTTNKQQFLGDETGSRRFWPIQVTGKTRLKDIVRDRDQLWAEALVRYKRHVAHVSQAADRIESPEQWWLTDREDALRVEASEEHQSTSVWLSIVQEWAKDRHYIRDTKTVLTDCMGQLKSELSERDGHRIDDILVQLGYKFTRPTWAERRRGYYSSEALEHKALYFRPKTPN